MNRTLRKDPVWFKRLDWVLNKSYLLGASFLILYAGIIVILTYSG